MRKILVATDFSACSDAAVDLALDVAQRYGATLTLLHVCELPSYTYFGGGVYVPSPELVEDILADARRGLAKARERVVKPGVTVETHSFVGDPGPAIVSYAHEHDHDLIVVGTHGRRGFRRLLLGSVAEQVVRAADVPVLAARPPKASPAAAASK
jgi:nucleotide-binding universal stress UspA family protein